jgi:hypothetical protein
MRRWGWLAAIGVVLIVNLVMGVGAARNRAGEPEAELRMTEREVPLAWVGEEDSGIALRLDWNRDWEGYDWLDEDKLAELGFDCDPPLTAETEEFHYEMLPPRRAYVVLEFEGAAWDDWLAATDGEIARIEEEEAAGTNAPEILEGRKSALERGKVTRSRLFPVDVGTDEALLRERYPDRGRYVVVAGVVRPRVHREVDEETGKSRVPVLRGTIPQLLVHRIHVNRQHRPTFEPLDGRGTGDGPRYEVTLRFGSRLEPWIAASRPLDPGP